MIVAKLQKSVRDVFSGWGLPAEDVAKINISFEHPAELLNGDCSTNVAFTLLRGIARPLGLHVGENLIWARIGLEKPTSPRQLAEGILRSIKKSDEVEKIEVAGAGFINFYLSKEFFVEAVKSVGEDFGKNQNLKGKRVMVEYTDPNPFKEFHVGHLMSNAIGESISRLISAEGAEVKRACYQGDVGLHVAKAIWGKQQTNNQPAQLRQNEVQSGRQPTTNNIKEWGKAYVLGAEKYETDAEAKSEIEKLNKIVYERSDAEINQLYDEGKKVSLAEFERLYQKLGTHFDFYFFESEMAPRGVEIVREGQKKGVFKESEGAVVFKGEQHGLHTRVFINSQGLPTYEAKELALAKAKYEAYPYDTSLVITGNEVNEYFRVLLKALELTFPDLAKRTVHRSHGMLRLPTGKMASRKGEVITAESLLMQVGQMVREKIAERGFSESEKARIAEAVAAGAIKYSILRQSVGGDIIFDFEKSISFEGDSGPYLQYSLTRAQSVLRKARADKVQPWDGKKVEPCPPVVLERLLYRFPEVVERAGKEYQPHFVTTYLTELAGAFNNWYAKEQIVDVTDPASPYKVALTEAFAVVMKNGLWLLGIPIPVKM